MEMSTDNGRMMVISQILFGQYHRWDIFGLGMKIKGFFVDETTE